MGWIGHSYVTGIKLDQFNSRPKPILVGVRVPGNLTHKLFNTSMTTTKVHSTSVLRLDNRSIRVN
jgi:hypothetical protein